jgi:phage FluMu gp28-like protein
MTQRAIQLYPYQLRWLSDRSRFKIGLQARQTGKSFAVSLEAADDAAATGQTWVMLSRGERQSKELIEKAQMHCKAYQVAASAIDEDVYKVDGNEYKLLQIVLNNGAKIIGLPANPDTARGFSANVILDEFAIHKDSDKIWTALYGTITRGYKLRVVSTPMGKSNKFYSLWSGNNSYSKHFTDIYKAVEEGLTVDITELRTGLDDEEAWAQEYECQFLDEATAFLPYDLISACESDQASTILPADLSGSYYIGIDIGRKRDLTVVWVLQQLGDVFYTRCVTCLEKTPFPEQRDFLLSLFAHLRPVRVCVDYTGMGGPITEDLQKRYGTASIEAVTFSNAVKSDLATRTRKLFEDHRVRIPIDIKIRNDLHSVKKVVTAAGNIRFDAERTKDGHADRFWALSLALMATSMGTIKPELIILTGADAFEAMD